MEIKQGKYILKSDRYTFWIEEEYTNKKGDIGTVRVAGYCMTIARLLEDFADKKLHDSDATTLEEVLTALKEAESDIKALAKAATKGKLAKEKK